MQRIQPLSVLILVLSIPFLPLAAADWSRFRGPGGSGVSDDTGLPVRWSDSEGVQWKTKLPGPGSSSPIESKGRIFLTCYSGYGVDRGGSLEDLRRHVVCLDEKGGKVLWDKSIGSRQPEQRYSGIGIPHHGYASSTPLADGERVFAMSTFPR